MLRGTAAQGEDVRGAREGVQEGPRGDPRPAGHHPLPVPGLLHPHPRGHHPGEAGARGMGPRARAVSGFCGSAVSLYSEITAFPRLDVIQCLFFIVFFYLFEA